MTRRTVPTSAEQGRAGGVKPRAVAELTVIAMLVARRPMLAGLRWLHATHGDGTTVIGTQRAGLIGRSA